MLHAVGQKARVFAAAVVVALVNHKTCGRGNAQIGEQARHVAAAAQRLVVQAGFFQHLLHVAHVKVFAVVAGAQQRRLLRREAKLGRATGFDKRQRLQGFECGAGKGQPVRVTRMGDQLALGGHDSDGAKVLAFQRVCAGEFDERGVVWVGISHALDCQIFLRQIRSRDCAHVPDLTRCVPLAGPKYPYDKAHQPS